MEKNGLLVINIDIDEKVNIIEGLKSLKPLPGTNSKASFDEERNEPLLLTKLGKKDKKKKKKKKGKEGLFDGVDFSLSKNFDDDDEGEEQKEERKFTFLEADDMFRDDEETDLTEEISKDQKKNYKKRESDFEKKFDEELTILYDLLEEVNKFGKSLEKKYHALEASKVRGISKYTNDLIVSILSSKASKLQIVKEIAAIKKTIQDLKFKAEKEARDKEGDISRDQIAAAYLSRVFNNVGRNNFIQGAGGMGFAPRSQDDDDDDEVLEEIESRRGNSDYQRERIYDMILNRLENERDDSVRSFYRAPEADIYLKYENEGINICVKRCIDDGSWQFIAVNRDGQEVPDYPLPKKKDVGSVKFSADGRRMTDGRGVTYKVIEYSAPIE
jgi:hypothetical protein